ncbi:hypothetical protein GCM10010466_35460 [Planomonospora alba]|uniref:SDR family oxidoreductase n=2 Tax=Planomonospora alba TaxID=161354 RepID=A0ABP6NA53_9ACTN
MALAELPPLRRAQHRPDRLGVPVPRRPQRPRACAVPELRFVAHAPHRKRIETLAEGLSITAGQGLLRWKFLHCCRDPINIGSINADRTPFPDQSIYALTKGALASLTRGLARELAPRQITINNIQPGPIDTDANPADGPTAQAMLGVMATDRYGTAAEVGAFVSYLAGPDADYITGSSLNIDGGFTA